MKRYLKITLTGAAELDGDFDGVSDKKIKKATEALLTQLAVHHGVPKAGCKVIITKKRPKELDCYLL